MGDISTHFSRKDFTCHCGCGLTIINTTLLSRLEAVRNHFNSPVIVECTCRCPAHNKMVGGEPKSKHLSGEAADIKVVGVSPDTVWKYFEESFPNTGGLGRYNTFTHIDVRPEKARWDFRK